MKDDKKTWTIKVCFCGEKLKCFTWFCVFSIKNILEIYMELEAMLATQIIIVLLCNRNQRVQCVLSLPSLTTEMSLCWCLSKHHIGNFVLKDSIKPCYHMFKWQYAQHIMKIFFITVHTFSTQTDIIWSHMYGESAKTTQHQKTWTNVTE